MAADTYWASNIVSIEPAELPDGTPARVEGFARAHEKLDDRLSACAMDDLMIDGPFVTGNHFALFLDMIITSRATGERRPFSEIAIYTVEGGKIIEERYFYEQEQPNG